MARYKVTGNVGYSWTESDATGDETVVVEADDADEAADEALEKIAKRIRPRRDLDEYDWDHAPVVELIEEESR